MIWPIFGCAKYDLQWYSSEVDNMNCYREKLKDSLSQVSLSFQAKRTEIHIPLIYRNVEEKSPYRIKFVSSTNEHKFESATIISASLTNSTGKIIPLMNRNNPIKLNYSFEKYSGYAQGRAFEAVCLLPEKLYIDYEKHDKLTVSLIFLLKKANSTIHETVVADFYPIHEKGMDFIFQTYTN